MFSKGPKAAYPWLLKGGYAMELRMHAARTTKDIDLTLHESTRLSKDPEKRREEVRVMLQEAAGTRFDDFFEFLVGEAREELDGAPEGGSRYPVAARAPRRLCLHTRGTARSSVRPFDSRKSFTPIRFRGLSGRTRELRISSTWCCSFAQKNSTR
jgi:hypothetical protein